MFDKPALIAKFIGYAVVLIWGELKYALRAVSVRYRARWFGATAAADRSRNIVIVGASFAGYHVARIVARSLPPKSPYRVVVVEPNSHFHFTWVLPRFCVVKGHESKAFIPYGGYVAGAPDGVIRWVKDRVASVSPAGVRLQGRDEEIPYDFLVIATGSKIKDGLPSRVNATDKNEGMRRMRAIQDGIEAAKTVVVVGGGAAGVEVATDAKDLYPDKRIVLVHSRSAVMHRFGKILQDAAQKGLERLGVELILEDRVVNEDAAAGIVTLRSGKEIPCDYYVSESALEKPNASTLATMLPANLMGNPDQLRGPETSLRRGVRAFSGCDIIYRARKCQGHSADCRRQPSKRLRLRRRRRIRGAESKCPCCNAPGNHRGREHSSSSER